MFEGVSQSGLLFLAGIVFFLCSYGFILSFTGSLSSAVDGNEPVLQMPGSLPSDSHEILNISFHHDTDEPNRSSLIHFLGNGSGVVPFVSSEFNASNELPVVASSIPMSTASTAAEFFSKNSALNVSLVTTGPTAAPTAKNQLLAKVSESAVQGVSPTLDGTLVKACKRQFDKRLFVPPKFQKHPVFLYTFPGSGNTWTRLLLEYATGYYSGSVYGDKRLLPMFPGENVCGPMVSVIKAHPHSHPVSFLRSTFRCHRPISENSARVILLIRNPFDAIWSEYQRQVTHSHTEGIAAEGFDWVRWKSTAGALAHSYKRMWAEDYSKILKHMDAIIVRYEELTAPGKRDGAVSKLIQFLNLTSEAVIDKELITLNPFTAPRKMLKRRLTCSYLLAEKEQIHRHVGPLVMQKDAAYTKNITCGMWTVFGAYASRYGYLPRNNFKCAGYSALPDNKKGH